MAVALEWVSRITAIAMAMVLPGLFGYWLDSRFNTSFLTPAGFVLGIVGGMWSLLVLTGAIKGKSNRSTADNSAAKRQDD